MATMETITDAAVALERCADLFAADPIGCNMVAASLRPPEPAELFRFSSDGRTVGTAIRWGDDYTLSSLSDPGEYVLADVLPVDRKFELFGPTGPVADVAGRWSQRCDGRLRPVEMMRVYRLGHLLPPSKVVGQLTLAADEHVAVGAEWSIAFSEEIGHTASSIDAATAQLGRAVDQGRLFTWQVDDEQVAQVLIAVERFGVVRIGAVYTPPHQRRRGYAAAMTAAVSEHLLSRPDVDTVTLNTQAANSATNRLYRRLGFEAHHEVLTIELDPTV